MGIKVPKDTPPMERELIYLLTDLCVIWGFCIPPDDFDEISKQAYYHALDFAEDVLIAEGTEAPARLRKRIAERFKERFGTDEIDSATFVDRVRGNNENWQNL